MWKYGVIMDENKEIPDVIFKKASELKNENSAPSFEEYKQRTGLSYIINSSANPSEVEKSEEEWFEINVKKAKWFKRAKLKILDPEDYQVIGKNKDGSPKQFIKKTGVKKLANAFGISSGIKEIKENVFNWGDKEGYTTYKDMYKSKEVLSSPKGKEYSVTIVAWARQKVIVTKDEHTFSFEKDYVEAVASCSNIELASKKAQSYNKHTIISTCETRATNRAILNLLGGAVSWEEIAYDENPMV
jgi:hypothetical protein